MFGLSNFIITEFLLIFYSLVTNVLYSYKDEPINRDPDTSMEISEELQAKLDEIRKQFKF